MMWVAYLYLVFAVALLVGNIFHYLKRIYEISDSHENYLVQFNERKLFFFVNIPLRSFFWLPYYGWIVLGYVLRKTLSFFINLMYFVFREIERQKRDDIK